MILFFFSPISAQVMYTPNTQITYAFSSVTTLNICQYMFENNNKQNICTFSVSTIQPATHVIY